MKINSKAKNIISSLVIASAITLPMGNVTLAKQESNSYKEIKVYLNDEVIEFDQEPIIVDGRTKVPFRAIFETMGTIVYYKESNSTILALTRNGDTIYHTIGSNTATINGIENTYDTVSEIVNNRTLIPVKMVSDLLRATVAWNEKEQSVRISKGIMTNEYNQKIRGIMECALDHNFNPENFKRYMEYQYKNWGMDPKQVILDVNMDLDAEFVLQTFQDSYGENKHIRMVPKDEYITYVENDDSNTLLVNKFNLLPDDYVPNDLIEVPKVTHPDGVYPHIDFELRNKVYEYFMEFNDAFSKYFISHFGSHEGSQLSNAYLNGGWRNWFISVGGYNTSQDIYRTTMDNVFYGLSQIPGITEEHKILYGFGHTFEDLRTGLTFSLPYSYAPYSFKEHMGYELTDTEEHSANSELRISDDEKWLEENAHKYGFIQRYPRGKEHITRMRANHAMWRYVGKDAAKFIYDQNLCLEEYCAMYESQTSYKTTEESIKKVLKKY